MRCMLDTNILVSAALFPESVCAAAYMKAVVFPWRCVVCRYTLDELGRVFAAKFPHRLEAYAVFAALLAMSAEVVSVPPEGAAAQEEGRLRDATDRPILRAALAADVDVLVTGDKGFLKAALQRPKVVSAAGFLEI